MKLEKLIIDINDLPYPLTTEQFLDGYNKGFVLIASKRPFQIDKIPVIPSEAFTVIVDVSFWRWLKFKFFTF